MPRVVLLIMNLLVLGLAGCVTDEAAPSEPAEPPSTDVGPMHNGPLIIRKGCSGYNAITFADGAAMRPHVPPNWTFTSPSGRDELSILRIHVVGCEEGLHLILSTPMHPDEASAHHHDNPDVVLGIYTDNETAASDWTKAGIPAQLATIDWRETVDGDIAEVSTDAGLVLRLVSIDPHHPPNSAYAWPAAYAAGTENITWFWGHENASARRVALREATLGPAAPIPGITATQWFVEAWVRFEVRYGAGTPRRD